MSPEMDLCKKNKSIFWQRERKKEFFDGVSIFPDRQGWGETEQLSEKSYQRSVERTPLRAGRPEAAGAPVGPRARHGSQRRGPLRPPQCVTYFTAAHQGDFQN